MRPSLLLPAIAIALLTPAAAHAQAAAPATAAQTAKGDVLVDAGGMALYTFDRDAAGASACNGQCAVNWPPLAAAEGAAPAGDWTIVTRADGARQWAYKGKPLYRWIKDQKAGDVTGDGVGSVWHLAKP
jgi:predicted lipoprotein with Yx(FWY)xxD motif